MIEKSSVEEGGRFVHKILVGVKLDAPELLTWTLAKVAEPGDTVMAIYIVGNEIVDRAGKSSSLLSLVKTFDSVLDVYEGFCNLKQVDLKLKLCRGNSARKIIAKEAMSFGASKVLVGVSKTHHAIRSSASVAKYLAKKLPKDCWVHAVNNGKTVFQREWSHLSKGKEDVRKNNLLNVLQRSVTLSTTKKTSSPDNSPRKPHEKLEGLYERLSSACQVFKYKELVSATSNFSADNYLGLGGSSRVFRGCLSNGREVAVKILKQTEDILNDFVAEIEIITTLHHKNVISLLGFCFEDNNLLLVYNYLSRGSLEDNLHGGKKDSIAFLWSERFKVAVGVAEALDYLHNSASQPVIHRDVKSSNILLSNDFEPQLSDFGLARWASISTTHIVCSDVAGTFGYLAPEYFMYGTVNDKIDVYAFGVVLLELLSGRKPISSGCPKGQESLVMWAKPILDGGKYSELLDPSLRDNNNGDQMQRMALAATLCIRRSPQARPKMSIVVKLLKGDEYTLKWAMQQVSSSSDESEMLKDEKCQRSNMQSHLKVALLDVEDDSLSMESFDQGVSVEDYLKGRNSID
ncbi:Protein kinase protein with adenine nucleotide alpha hydrolases-like domain [Raphanus sativus]|uniref:Protein kinase STUNTED-like n=1 Tax=Raphanus sativus TaxID=3726 RepID=A0A9W3DS88_RAPSA|nr:protein kinase STUNTED-like [Raphanus sativus]KAJ4895020.1 Protein kinase protein with adenine nucleotide alpha hydrolases-like domain [Raphanus sativus]